MEYPYRSLPRPPFSRRQADSVGRTVLARLRARRHRRLVESTPRRRVSNLAGVARATVVGRITDVAGDGPAVETWRGDDPVEGFVDRRTTRPFVLDDGSGRISVRVPPDGGIVVHGEAGREYGDRPSDGSTVVEPGDTVAVTGQVVRDTGVSDANTADGNRTLTGPTFVLAAPP